jgi:membrane associated rhomboid family serine protease
VLADGARQTFVGAFALVPFDVTHGIRLGDGPPAALTLLTSQFLHASVPHIAFNMLFLAVFGPEIEYLTGSLRFVAFYLCCGILGGLAQISIDPSSHVPEIGASGAIAGALGAFVLRYPLVPVVFGLPAFVVIGLWAGVQFVHGFGPLAPSVLSERGGGTAYFAHIGGFLAGVLGIGLFGVRAPSPRGPHLFGRLGNRW